MPPVTDPASANPPTAVPPVNNPMPPANNPKPPTEIEADPFAK
jgi:hypothetical protein